MLRNFRRGGVVIYWYFVLPTVGYSLTRSLVFYPKVIYDLFLIALFVISSYLVLFKGRVYHIRPAFGLFLIVFLFVCFWLLKQFNFVGVEAWGYPQYFGAFARELKPIFYFFSAAVYLLAFGRPSKKWFLYGGVYFSAFIIFDAAIKLFVYGAPSRPYIVDEANYDNFLVLLSLIALFVIKPKKFYYFYLLFLVATLVSQSKTGIVSFFFLSIYYFVFQESKFAHRAVFLFVLLASLPFVALIFIHRLEGSQGILQVDRLRMIGVFVDYLSDANIFSVLFGQLPGAKILSYDYRLEWFIRAQSEAIGAFGLHPFNLHGFHMRFISSWGVVLYALVIFWMLFSLRNSIFSRYIMILFFIQGFALGVFYLSVVSVIFLLFIVSADDTADFVERNNSGLKPPLGKLGFDQ